MDTVQIITWSILILTVIVILLNKKVRTLILDKINEKIDTEKELSGIRNEAYRTHMKKVAIMQGIQKAENKLTKPGTKSGLGSNMKELIKETSNKQKGLKKGLKINIPDPKPEKKEEFPNLKKMMGAK